MNLGLNNKRHKQNNFYNNLDFWYRHTNWSIVDLLQYCAGFQWSILYKYIYTCIFFRLFSLIGNYKILSVVDIKCSSLCYTEYTLNNLCYVADSF